VAIAVGGLLAAACTPPAGTTTRVSVGLDGRQADDRSNEAAISADGRLVAFTSTADNFGAEDNFKNVFLKDRRDGTLTLVNTSFDGRATGGESSQAAIAQQGQAVAFTSDQTDLRGVPDGNGRILDVYVRLLGENRTVLASAAAGGGAANDFSRGPDITPNARFVAFESAASNIVAGDTNERIDVFVSDLADGTTRRASLSRTGAQLSVDATKAAVSADGTKVGFVTTAVLSRSDTDADHDVYVKDMLTGAVTLASIDGLGPDDAFRFDMSDDGRYVAFVSQTTSSLQTFVRDLATGQLTLVSHKAGSTVGGNGSSLSVSISPDGSHVAFSSDASDLVSGDTNGAEDDFVAGRDGSGVKRVSVRSDGGQTTGVSGTPKVSNAATAVAFSSTAPDLVAGDTNGVRDIFVRE